jgi:hypothetical protein
MNAPFLDAIDWSRPWLTHVHEIGEQIAGSPDWRQELNRRAAEMGLRNHRSLPIQFVAQSHLPPDTAYETFISNTGCVPTRENLHDFFNALVWLTFPRIKAQLNALQAQEIERVVALSAIAPRGKLRDAATIFDENATLLITSNQELVSALRAHEWEKVFITHRNTFIQDCDVFIFGHALMEKLVSPYKAITGHVWVASLGDAVLSLSEQLSGIDVAVAQQLLDGLSTADFSPLPVLGVPAWWEEQEEMFYQDKSVFRPKRNT